MIGTSLALGLLFWLSSGQAAENIIAVRAGTLVHPDRETVAKDQVVLVRNGRIDAVGGEVSIPSSAKVVDLSDSTVLPGLMDCETHLNVSVISRPDIPRPQQRGSTGAAF